MTIKKEFNSQNTSCREMELMEDTASGGTTNKNGGSQVISSAKNEKPLLSAQDSSDTSQEVTQNDPIERAIKSLIKVSLKNNNLVCPKCGKEYHSPIVIKTIREQAISNFAEKIKGEIELCLKDTNKKKELGMPQGYDWRGEALGYKTCLNIIKNKLVEEQSSGETK